MSERWTAAEPAELAGKPKKRCQDCGKYVEAERWSVDQRNPLCADCSSLYDDPQFM